MCRRGGVPCGMDAHRLEVEIGCVIFWWGGRILRWGFVEARKWSAGPIGSLAEAKLGCAVLIWGFAEAKFWCALPRSGLPEASNG